MIVLGCLLACTALAQAPEGHQGLITGMVVNGSRQRMPLAGAEVVLRVGDGVSMVPVVQATTDDYGVFRLQGLPLQPELIYLPGANHDGIHYPGPRVHLDGSSPGRHVTIVAYDAVAAPSPLTAERHEIVVRADVGVLKVTETLVVANPTLTSYVGRPAKEGETPVTLRLSIPETFEKVTFEKEFYGRQFKVAEGFLETDIPWTPGRRELKFTYLVPFESRHWLLRRPLDLPCAHVRIVVDGEIAEATCNLPQAARSGDAHVFELQGQTLPAGHAIELELGHLPVPFTAYAKWIAVALLAVLVLAAGVVVRRRREGQPAYAGNASAALPPKRRRRGRRPGEARRRVRRESRSRT